jgi:hypothetical protein
MNKVPFLFVLGVVGALILGGFTGYVYYSQGVAEQDLKKYDLQVANLENEVVQFEGENLGAAVSAKQALNVLKSDSIIWSEVIENILNATPKHTKTRIPLVEYVSYSGSQNNSVNINARTIPGSNTPFGDVAGLIRSFEKSSYFADPFVPSISTGVSDEGNLVLVFSFNVLINNE